MTWISWLYVPLSSCDCIRTFLLLSYIHSMPPPPPSSSASSCIPRDETPMKKTTGRTETYCNRRTNRRRETRRKRDWLLPLFSVSCLCLLSFLSVFSFCHYLLDSWFQNDMRRQHNTHDMREDFYDYKKGRQVQRTSMTHEKSKKEREKKAFQWQNQEQKQSVLLSLFKKSSSIPKPHEDTSFLCFDLIYYPSHPSSSLLYLLVTALSVSVTLLHFSFYFHRKEKEDALSSIPINCLQPCYSFQTETQVKPLSLFSSHFTVRVTGVGITKLHKRRGFHGSTAVREREAASFKSHIEFLESTKKRIISHCPLRFSSISDYHVLQTLQIYYYTSFYLRKNMFTSSTCNFFNDIIIIMYWSFKWIKWFLFPHMSHLWI